MFVLFLFIYRTYNLDLDLRLNQLFIEIKFTKILVFSLISPDEAIIGLRHVGHIFINIIPNFRQRLDKFSFLYTGCIRYLETTENVNRFYSDE